MSQETALLRIEALLTQLLAERNPRALAAAEQARRISESRQRALDAYLAAGGKVEPGDEDEGYQGNRVPLIRCELTDPISTLNLSVRGTKCMFRCGVKTVGDLILKTEEDLLQIRNFGITTLLEVRARLAERGLRLKEPHP